MGPTLPDTKKKHMRISRKRNYLKEFLFRPKTWKIALAILGFILKIVRAAAKVGELFE